MLPRDQFLKELEIIVKSGSLDSAAVFIEKYMKKSKSSGFDEETKRQILAQLANLPQIRNQTLIASELEGKLLPYLNIFLDSNSIKDYLTNTLSKLVPALEKALSDIVDVREYPTAVVNDPSRNTISLGDMHGNTMKILWCLAKEGVIALKKEDFARMWELYDKLDDPSADKVQTEKNFKEFLELIEKIEIKTSQPLVELLGDVLGDRGANDLLTLKLLEKLQQSKVKFSLLFGDHEAFLLSNLEKAVDAKPEADVTVAIPPGHEFNLEVTIKEPDQQKPVIIPRAKLEWIFENQNNQQKSMVGLYSYIKKGLVSQDEVRSLYDRVVKSSVKLITYHLSEDRQTIELGMHAPNNFAVIQGLAKELLGQDIDQHIEAEALAKTVDAINEKFQLLLADKLYIAGKKIPRENVMGFIAGHKKFVVDALGQPLDQPRLFGLLQDCAWNRLDAGPGPKGQIDFNTYPKCVSYFIHGHTPVEGNPEKQKNLDNPLGKSKDNRFGRHFVHNSHGYASLALLKAAEIEKCIKRIDDIINIASKKSETLLPAQEEAKQKLLIQKASRLCNLYLEAFGKSQDEKAIHIVSKIKELLNDDKIPTASKLKAMKDIMAIKEAPKVMQAISTNSWGEKFIHFMKNILTGHWRAAITSVEKICKEMEKIGQQAHKEQPSHTVQPQKWTIAQHRTSPALSEKQEQPKVAPLTMQIK